MHDNGICSDATPCKAGIGSGSRRDAAAVVLHSPRSCTEAVGHLRAGAAAVGHAAHLLDEALIRDGDRGELPHDGAGQADFPSAHRCAAARLHRQRETAFCRQAKLGQEGQDYGAQSIHAPVDSVASDTRECERDGLLAEGQQRQQALDEPADGAAETAIVLDYAASEHTRRVPQCRTGFVDFQLHAVTKFVEQAEERGFAVLQPRSLAVGPDCVDS